MIRGDVERALRVLHESGYRVTGPRRAIVEAVHRTHGAFTAEELISTIARSRRDVGRATVFRTLDLLVEEGLLDRIHLPDGCHSYVLSIGSDRHHHHLICSDCGTVVQFEECPVDPVLQELANRTQFSISGHWLEVFGVCAACRP